MLNLVGSERLSLDLALLLMIVGEQNSRRGALDGNAVENGNYCFIPEGGNSSKLRSRSHFHVCIFHSFEEGEGGGGVS